jgi:hypothetical protein
LYFHHYYACGHGTYNNTGSPKHFTNFKRGFVSFARSSDYVGVFKPAPDKMDDEWEAEAVYNDWATAGAE